LPSGEDAGMRNNRVFFLLAFAIFVLIFSVLTVLFWSFMTDKILIPIYYVLWVCNLIINSVPQGAYLLLLVILSIVIGLRTLTSLRSNLHHRRARHNQPNPATRYQHWRILCAYAYGTWFSKSQVTFESRKLILSILAFEQGVDLLEAEDMVRNGALDIPDMLRDVIVSKYIPDAPPNRFPGILSWLPLPARWRKADYDPCMDQFLTEFVNFVEHHLEITSHARNEFES
jgi:hypothetical protein